MKLEAALAALGDVGGLEVILLQSSLKSAKRGAHEPALDVQLSQCEQFVARAQKRLAAHDEERVPSGFRVAGRRKLTCLIARGSHSGQRCPHSTASSTRRGASCSFGGDGEGSARREGRTLSQRPGSCGAFPLPESLSELSTLVQVKTRELINALFQEDGDRVTRLSPALATIRHKINVVQNGSTEQDAKRRAVSNAPITCMVANRVS